MSHRHAHQAARSPLGPLIAALLTGTAFPAMAAGSANTDMPGSDLGRLPGAASAEVCSNACQGESACKAWTIDGARGWLDNSADAAGLTPEVQHASARAAGTAFFR